MAGPLELDVALLSGAHLGSTRVKLADMELGDGEAGFRALKILLRQLVRNEPMVLGEIRTAPHVTHRDVVRVIDAFQGAGIDDISFIGAPPARR